MAGNFDSFMIICRLFSIITVLATVLCLAVNVLYAVRSFMNELSDVFDGIFRCFAILISIFVIVAETEWDIVLQFWKLLEYWVGRGMLQIFVAVMTRAYPEKSDDSGWFLLVQDIASYLLLGCGAIYLIAGIFCMGHVKRNRERRNISREQAVKDLHDLEQRKMELEALLVVQERA